MHTKELLRWKSIELPVVYVDFMIQGLTDPKITKSFNGVRRRDITEAAQVLEEAKRNQRDGKVELKNIDDVTSVLKGTASIVDWQNILLFNFDDDDELT